MLFFRPVVQLYHETKMERDKLLEEISILKEEHSTNEINFQKALIENLALNKVTIVFFMVCV